MDSSLSGYWVWEIVPSWWNRWLCSLFTSIILKSSHCLRSLPLSCWNILLYHGSVYCCFSKVGDAPCFIIFVIIIDASQFAKCHGRRSLLLKPDFSKLTSAGFFYALGQSFASFTRVTAMLPCFLLRQETNLVQSGISIVAMNISAEAAQWKSRTKTQQL